MRLFYHAPKYGILQFNSVFALPDSETDTDKMGTESKGNLCWYLYVQYEHIHIIVL